MRADPAVGGLQTTLTVRSRPAMSSGTAPSMMAIARAPSLEGRLRSVVINRAMLCADGFFCGPAAGDMASASRRRRVDLRNTSVRPPRTIWRTMPRDLLMRRTISVDRHASLCQREHGGILVLALDPAVILAPLGRRKKCRVHDTGPECLRIFCMDCLIAPRKAALAFSIRCQRSATCTASGRPWIAACTNPAPRSRAMMVMDGCSASHLVTVAASRSGRMSTIRRCSRSQMIVP
jgi:hypothetical protein